MNEDTSKEYFREGCQGYRDGARNPYPAGTSAANQWRLGWQVERSCTELERKATPMPEDIR